MTMWFIIHEETSLLIDYSLLLHFEIFFKISSAVAARRLQALIKRFANDSIGDVLFFAVCLQFPPRLCSPYITSYVCTSIAPYTGCSNKSVTRWYLLVTVDIDDNKKWSRNDLFVSKYYGSIPLFRACFFEVCNFFLKRSLVTSFGVYRL